MDPADQEWLTAVRSGHPPDVFGHREHLRLAWLTLVDAGTIDVASSDVSASIRKIAAARGAPQKYNETVTGAWVRIVDHVRTSRNIRSFERLLDVAPWLLDKRLLLRHYRSRTLASEAARHTYIPPDVRPIPA